MLARLPSLPPNESARLAALHAQAILDTPPEPEFDALTRLAAELCAAPIALVSLIDADRQWFKARVGLTVSETPREHSLCAHGILEDGLFEVEDATTDPRFADNPLVRGDPNIRFYAGAPLRTDDGLALGTLCVIDRVPRRLSEVQRDGLTAIGRQVMTQMAIRRAVVELRPPADPHLATVRRPAGSPEISLVAPRVQEEQVRFGRFIALGAIGHGAMATVYAAFDAELQRRVAVKVVHATDADEQARVQKEAHALARISHPNVVQIYEVGTVGRQTFIAMEFVPGVTLTLWQEAHPRGLRELLAMYVQAGRGLVAAHTAGIVHRDFKPDNVLVGVDGRPRVADFGLARFRGSEDLLTTHTSGVRRVDETSVGEIVGTPAYMSPEQYESAQVDARADQYSFCAALYEALYGVRPFAGNTLDEIRRNIRTDAMHAPSAGQRIVPIVHDAILRGLSRDPAERWPSFTDLLDHLERYDPHRDAASARGERRSLSRVLQGLMLGTGAVMLIGSAYPGFYNPFNVIAPGVLVLAVLAVVLGRMRASLLTNHVHRRMVEMMLTTGIAICVGRGFGVLADLQPTHVILCGMLSAGVATAVLAAFIARFMASLAAVQLICAVLLAADLGPLGPLDVAAQTLTALLFVRAWNVQALRPQLRAA